MDRGIQLRPNGIRPVVRPVGPAAAVHVPFTAPLLAGTRARLRGRITDFVLPNPSGGRGAYVAIWSMVTELAGPTVHDAILSRRLQALPALTPGAVRGAGRAVAAEGHAGRAAAAAAVRAQAATDAEALRLWAVLLMALIRRSAIPSHEHVPALASLGAAGPDRITDGFAAVSRRLGWDPVQLGDALREVSGAFVTLGRGGRMRRLATLLDGLRSGLLDVQARCPSDAAHRAAALARTVQVVGQCSRRANALLDAGTLALEEPHALLEQWRQDPAGALSTAAALDELLDGWDRICLLWHDAATPSARLEVLPEVALLVRLAAENDPTAAPPPDPGVRAAPAVPAAPPAVASRPHGADGGRPAAGPLRTASPAATAERNERIRTLELALDDGHG